MELSKTVHAYREVLRTSLKRQCSRFVSSTRGGRAPLPEKAVLEQVYSIHVLYLELLRYTQMVLGNWKLVDEDEKFRSICMKECLDAYEIANGVAATLVLGKSLSNLGKTTHKEINQSKYQIGSETVLI